MYIKRARVCVDTYIETLSTVYSYKRTERSQKEIEIHHGNSTQGFWEPWVEYEPRRIGWVEAWRLPVGGSQGKHCIYKIGTRYDGEDGNTKILNNRERGDQDWSGPMQPPPEDPRYFVRWAGRSRDRLDAIAPLYAAFQPTN